MKTWAIAPCTVADAAQLAHNNMSAFWEDPHWRQLWPNITFSYLVEQSIKRQPRNLLRDRENTRHQKVVDPSTGVVVGYARWILPSGFAVEKDGEGGAGWTEAQVEDVSEEERKRFEELAKSAWWGGAAGMSGIDDKSYVVMNRILEEKPYISTSHQFLPAPLSYQFRPQSGHHREGEY
jgi:hypothetical protein